MRTISILIHFLFLGIFTTPLYAQTSTKINSGIDEHELVNHHIQLIKSLVYVSIDSSKYHFNEAIHLSKKIGNKELEAKAKLELGVALLRKQKYLDSKDYLEKGLELSKELDDSELLSEAYRHIGNLHWDLSNLKEALTSYSVSKKYAEKSGDPKLIGLTLNSFGILYIHLKKYDKALEYLRKALISIKQSNFKHGELLVTNNISWAYLGKEDYQSAVDVLEEKMVAGKFSNDKILNLWALSKYAKALIEIGEVGKGFDIMNKAKEEASQLKLDTVLDEIIIFLTSCYLKFDLIDQTIETALEGIEASKQSNRVKYLPSLYSQLSQAYEKKKDYKKALLAMENSKEAKEVLLLRQKEKEVLGFEMQNQIQKKEAENELLQLKNTNQKIYIGLLVTTFLLFSAFLFFYFQKKQRMQITKFRQRIAADLHDDVSGNLSTISRMAKGLISNNNSTEVNLKADQLVKKSNESIKNVADVIWSLSEDESELSFLFDKLEDHLDLIRSNNKSVKIEVNKNKIDERLNLSLNIRHHLLMIFKESINNIQKHTVSTFVKVDLKEEEKKLEISIYNEFDQIIKNSISSGRGIENIKRRVKELKGSVDIHNTSNSFLIKIKVDIY